MKTFKEKIFDTTYLTYVSLLLLSFIIFCLTDTFTTREPFAIFTVHYAFALITGVLTLTLFRKNREGLFSVVLLIFLVSCYALNRVFEIFDASTAWFCVVLIASSTGLLLFRFFENMPKPLQWFTLMLMGLGMVTWAYLAIYLLPIYLVSIPGLLLFGLSVHSFIPLVLFGHSFLLIRKHSLQLSARLMLAVGIAAPLVAAVFFTIEFNQTSERLNRTFHREQLEATELPAWVEAAMKIAPGSINDKVLKTGLIYRLPDAEQLFGVPRKRTEEPLVHDPLVTIAINFSPELTLDEDSRLRIMETRFNAHHATQERLWRGDDLITSYVNTRVQVWPKLHMAYTEKMISVHNTSTWATEEGIYSFYLPEGAVVTSLSLWINGKEEKSILTTREKADTAYRTIVGGERRDPSLVRWQEGNTVSVRVYPVAEKSSRQFKIGFTAPLSAKDKQITYRNSWFSGPRTRNTAEDITVEFMTPPAQPVFPKNFTRRGDLLTSESDYKADWEVSFADEGLQNASFSFNGYEYTLKPYTMQRTPAAINAVYLDVNAAWTESECNQIVKMAGGRPVYVWDDHEMKVISRSNLQQLLQQNFSVFPVHRIKDTASAMLITKSTAMSPHVSDLKGSDFSKELDAWRSRPGQPKICLLNIGGELNTYLRSLREQRIFRYEQGGLLLVKVLLDGQQFAADAETPNRIVINDANLFIEKTPGTGTGNAPDHLMRLFAYNHIMQQRGRGAMPDSLVTLAQEAYVVTPLTSLVVLETQADYDRFGIKDSGNSLKNASTKKSGAVPEPHEWALIILALLTLLYVKFKHRWNRLNA